MTLHEIRETIEQEKVQLDILGFGIVQKQINLPSNKLNQVLKVDFFQDSLPLYTSPEPLYIELIVTPYPVIFSNMRFSGQLNYQNRGPMAGSDTVLFKSIVGPYDIISGNFPAVHQFPNESVGATPTFSFYTPSLYITALFHGGPSGLIEHLALSCYLAMDSKNTNLTSYGLGVLRERSVAQGITLMNQGRTILAARNVGQVFPMWQYGGIRPERMLRANALADFFLPYHPNETEAMVTTTNLRTFINAARTMQPFDTAFGALDPSKGNVPDWVKFNLARGLVAGPVRAQQPPTKYADNGNTLML